MVNLGWTYMTLADHCKTTYEIFYNWYGATLFLEYYQGRQETSDSACYQVPRSDYCSDKFLLATYISEKSKWLCLIFQASDRMDKIPNTGI